MCNIVYIKKNLKKISPDERKYLEKCVDKLAAKIDELAETGVIFEKIFNDPSIKYDIYANSYYAVKFSGRKSLRVLYRFVRINEKQYSIEIHMLCMKKSTDTKYIETFQEYALANA